MKKRRFIELIPLVLFLFSLIFNYLHIDLSSIILIDGMLLMIIYMFFSYWLDGEKTIPIIAQIFIGLVYTLTILSIIFCHLNLYGNLFFIAVDYTLLIFLCLNCLFKIKRLFFKQHFYRSLLFIIMLTFAYSKKYLWSPSSGKMKVIFKLKEWQVFFLLVIPMLFTSNSIWSRIIISIWFSMYIGYIYSIGVTINILLSEKIKQKTAYFKISCFLLVISVWIILVLFGGYYIDQNNYGDYGDKIFLIIPFHLYLLWSILYVVYFTSQTLIFAINGNIANDSGLLKVVFALYFLPIGIWFIQPIMKNFLYKAR